MKLAITICATKSYCYALPAQARRVQAALRVAVSEIGAIILVGDKGDELKAAEALYRQLLPGFEVRRIIGQFDDGLQNYKKPAQLVIAAMRSTAFDAARALDVDMCWSLDSDVLPPTKALRCMEEMLAFDGGFYSVSTCPYPSQGGGDFLGGRGTPERPILPDAYDDELEVPAELAVRCEAHQARLKELQGKPDEAWNAERDVIAEEMKKCKRKGNVWQLNAVQYRRRGWLSSAYPGIGIGAILPSDWCGFGCTLMNREALALAQFDGYDGAGTEDLYICWKRWYRAGVRINVIPHAPCDHVIRDPERPGEYLLLQAYHEDRGECIGHLRMERRTWPASAL